MPVYFFHQKTTFAPAQKTTTHSRTMILHEHCTDRLRFRCLTEEDAPHLLAFFSNNKAAQFISTSDDLEAFTENWIARQLRRYATDYGGLYALELKDTGGFIGQGGLVRQFVDGIPKWEVGYHLMPKYWGNGYATEAATACRDFCFENEMAETLIAIIHPENKRSINVAGRNGMTEWKRTLFKDQEVVVMRIRREDWEKR